MAVQKDLGSKKMKSVGKTAAFALAIKVFAAAVTYGFTVALARMMDVNDFGIVGTLLTAALFLSVCGAFGQRMALLRFVPPLIEQKDAIQIKSQISHSFSLAAKGNLAVYLIALAGIIYAFYGSESHRLSTLALGLLLIPLVAWIDMQAHLARAYKAVALALIPKDVLWRLMTGLIIAVIYFSTNQQPVSLELVVYILIAVLVILIAAQAKLMWARLRIPALSIRTNTAGTQKWRQSITPFSISSVGSLAFSNLDVMLVGLMLGAESAAYYFAANRLSQVLSFFLMSYNIVIGPILSEDHAAGRMAKVINTVSLATVQAFVPTAVLALMLYFGAPFFLGLFGPEYSAAAFALQLLVLSGLMNVCMGPGDIVLNMCGYEKTGMHISLFSTIIGVVILIIFCHLGGINGMACGVFLAISIRKILFWAGVYRKMGVRCDIVNSLVHLLKSKQQA